MSSPIVSKEGSLADLRIHLLNVPNFPVWLRASVQKDIESCGGTCCTSRRDERVNVFIINFENDLDLDFDISTVDCPWMGASTGTLAGLIANFCRGRNRQTGLIIPAVNTTKTVGASLESGRGDYAEQAAKSYSRSRPQPDTLTPPLIPGAPIGPNHSLPPQPRWFATPPATLNTSAPSVSGSTAGVPVGGPAPAPRADMPGTAALQLTPAPLLRAQGDEYFELRQEMLRRGLFILADEGISTSVRQKLTSANLPTAERHGQSVIYIFPVPQPGEPSGLTPERREVARRNEYVALRRGGLMVDENWMELCLLNDIFMPFGRLEE